MANLVRLFWFFILSYVAAQDGGVDFGKFGHSIENLLEDGDVSYIKDEEVALDRVRNNLTSTLAVVLCEDHKPWNRFFLENVSPTSLDFIYFPKLHFNQSRHGGTSVPPFSK